MTSRNIAAPMGELLLRGWCMLAESCPECNIPLMRDPQSRERKCMLCQTLYPATGELQGPNAAVAAERAAAEQAAAEQAAASAAPAAGSEPKEGSGADTAAEVVDGRNDDAPWRSKNRESDEAAELLSAKMLQGWALLETSCPKCSTPLVRNREKRMMCVMCEAWVISAADAAKAAADAAKAAAEQKPPADSVLPLPDAAPLQLPAGCDASVTLPPPPVIGKPLLAALPPLPSADGAAGPGPVLGSPVPSRAFREVQQQAGSQASGAGAGAASFSPSPQLLAALAASLEEKLWQAQRLLAATPASSTEEVRGYLAVVSDCMDAMAKVRLEARHQQM